MAKQRLYEWKITRIRAKAEFVGCVEATDEKTATEAAAKQFNIPDHLRNRIVAQRRG
jgi:hypothetical protein